MAVPTWKFVASTLVFAPLMALGPPAAAEDYFKDKTITVQVPSGSGGSYHAYCQIVQRFLPDYIPGKPTSLVQNLPGAGGAKSAAYMYNVAPHDGSMIAMIAPGAITVPLVREVKYNAREFQWLGAPAARSAGVWFWHTHGVTTLQQLKDKVYTLGSTGFASAGSVFPRLMNATLGTKLDIIYGYKGGGALYNAVERGELHSRWNYRSGFTGIHPKWIPEKKIIPVIKMGPRDPAPVYDGVPHMRDLLADGSIEEKLYDLLAMNLEVGQAFYAPPGTPKEVVRILVASFSEMLADPDFKEALVKRRIEYSPVSAEAIREKIAHGFAQATPEVVDELTKIFTKAES